MASEAHNRLHVVLGNLKASPSIRWVHPSGPRSTGQGVEDEQQGIIQCELDQNGAVVMRITLLAAGFVIGHHGACVRQIGRASGADITSWTDNPKPSAQNYRACRHFLIQGEPHAVSVALEIINDAVTRYKELYEGCLQGQCVSQVQPIHDIKFMYQPPPRNAVPHAAALSISNQRGPLLADNPHSNTAAAMYSLAKMKQSAAAERTTNLSPRFASYIPAQTLAVSTDHDACWSLAQRAPPQASGASACPELAAADPAAPWASMAFAQDHPKQSHLPRSISTPPRPEAELLRAGLQAFNTVQQQVSSAVPRSDRAAGPLGRQPAQSAQDTELPTLGAAQLHAYAATPVCDTLQFWAAGTPAPPSRSVRQAAQSMPDVSFLQQAQHLHSLMAAANLDRPEYMHTADFFS